MAKAAGILGVHLLDAARGPTRVGTLTRDTDGAVIFAVAETYLHDTDRPILSLGWYDPTSEEGTRDRLAARAQKIATNGYLPPWFAGLLPEGALHELVLSEMGPGNHDQFDVLTRLGADLPGAVLIVPETDVPASAGPLDLGAVSGFRATQPQGVVKFSLAGIQLKFTANADGERLTMPGRGESGHCIIKVGSENYPALPEAEYAAMQLAREVGVDIAGCRLVSRDRLQGIPEKLLAHGEQVLVVERFDRLPEGGRIHIEDAAQILGAVADRKYTMGTTETVINMVSRFSTDPRGDILEAIRRTVADVLVGNGDNHLKNWSFQFPRPGEIRLSKAYDIVPTVLYMPGDTLALRFVSTHQFEVVNLHRYERVASFLRVDPKWVLRAVSDTVTRALDTWPALAPDLLGEKRARVLLGRFDTLELVREVRAHRR